VPTHSSGVTGTHRGAERDVTGTSYFRASSPAAASSGNASPEGPADSVAVLDARFSVNSPQRSAQLRARAALDAEPAARSPAITGSFAIGDDRVTGNSEFHFQSRSVGGSTPGAGAGTPAAHTRLTGEGRAQGTRVSGWSWSENSQVTGTEGATAAERNPTERGGKAKAFAGVRVFKTLAKREESKQLVTGLLGWSGKTAAKVTLSGGAQA
jgi:hypothetical protein